MMLLDLLANFDWKRPIYFTQTHMLRPLGLHEYLQFDGFAYRLVPIKTPYTSVIEIGRVDTELLYDNLMNKFSYGNIADPKVYADSFIQNIFNSAQTRTAFARLANELVAQGDTTRAIQVLDRCLEVIPFSQIRHAYSLTMPVIEAYYNAGCESKANAILEDYANLLEQKIDYYMRFKRTPQQELSESITLLYELYRLSSENNQHKQASDISNFFVAKKLM